MAVAKNQNFEMVQGSDETLRFTVDNGATPAVPVDISAATFTWALGDYYGQATPLLTKATGSGIAIINGPSGIVDVTVSDTDTDALVGRYFHALRMTIAGKERGVARGTITVLPRLAA